MFINYAHADNGGPDPAARWLDRLLLNLKALALEGLFRVATDRDIGLGDDWHARIQADLNRADAAVLLVGPAFLASEYIRYNELPVLLHRAKTQGLRIVPVILRPCPYAETRFMYPDPRTGPEEFSLASLQAAGSPAKALNQMTEGEQDCERLRVSLSVAQALERWVDRPNTAPPEGLGSAAASGMPEPLTGFRDRLLSAGGTVPERRGDAAGPPAPRPGHRRGIPPRPHRRVVPAPLRTGQAFHPPDPSAGSGAGGRGTIRRRRGSGWNGNGRNATRGFPACPICSGAAHSCCSWTR
ncbi:MAG: toll/interleukin-1 receptor domain-containing protein [Actinomycetota bacterium]